MYTYTHTLELPINLSQAHSRKHLFQKISCVVVVFLYRQTVIYIQYF